VSVARLQGSLAAADGQNPTTAVADSAPPSAVRATEAQPRILFLDLTNDPGSDRIVAEMGRSGAICAVAGVAGAFSARSRFVRDFFVLPHWGGLAVRSFVLGLRLETIVRSWSPDMIVPIDDLAARMIRDPRVYERAGPALRLIIERSFGDPAHFGVACSRQGLAQAAREIGVRMPRQEIVPDPETARRAAAALGYPVVLKRELSCGGAGVAIVRSDREMVRAFRRTRLRARAKRLLGWAPGFSLGGQEPLTLQQHIRGALAYRVAACAIGVETEGVSFVARRDNFEETCASTIIRRLDNGEMLDATRKLIAALRCSGVISLDFILTEAGEAYLIEMNARPIASGHLGRLYGHDVYAAAIGARRSEPAVELAPPRAIALFPRELDRDPRSPYLAPSADVFHDVPWDDPAVVRGYSKWLRDRHPSHASELQKAGL
jgi:carbamoyl-phosphate synthase L subunit-like protein